MCDFIRRMENARLRLSLPCFPARRRVELSAVLIENREAGYEQLGRQCCQWMGKAGPGDWSGLAHLKKKARTAYPRRAMHT